eukprot:CAMPEP_0197896270 /NCGR_PEP_ID=MMETSP1439-20131203/39507_1 /TAXON_ID=66791 /ORGANISM="Gonyaulax spinifera, Strain CCMP409" /LENGTH=48 /DNA_ID= /DNA_START= /DNA_END= /DNA_ORIENTATION=
MPSAATWFAWESFASGPRRPLRPSAQVFGSRQAAVDGQPRRVQLCGLA